MDENEKEDEVIHNTHNLYNEETLVAENEMLQVYIVQAFFKDKKNFICKIISTFCILRKKLSNQYC